VRLRDVVQRISITPREIDTYLDRQTRHPSANAEYNVSHILIAVPQEATTAQLEAAQKKADDIYTRAKNGEDFAKLARETSDDAATRAEGGDLGTFGKDMLPKAIEELVFSMKVGDIRGPIRADRGFHVIKLVDRKIKDPKPFDEAKEEIRMQLRQKDMERQTKIYLAELRKKTLVDIRY